MPPPEPGLTELPRHIKLIGVIAPKSANSCAAPPFRSGIFLSLDRGRAMDLRLFPVELTALIISLLSLWIAVRALNTTKGNDLFALRQKVLLSSESARSAWYKLRHENDSMIQQVTLDSGIESPERASLLDFLADQRDHLDMCIRDAVALADDVRAHVGVFDEKKCREYLRLIEPSLEILARNQGVAERKVSDLLNRLAATSL